MRHWLHRSGAAVLITALGLLTPGLADAQSRPKEFGSKEFGPKEFGTAQPPRPGVLAQLELRDLSPRVVTVTSAPVLRVSGRVVNVGDRPITQLSVGVRRDEPVSSETAAQQALHEPTLAPTLTRSHPLPGALAPGQSRSFQYELPLRGGERTSLHLTTPGVYPVRLILSGQPDSDSGLEQLASVRLLLPVLGIPPAGSGGPPGPVLHQPAQPAPLTVLWPLAAAPQRLPSSPGEPVVVPGERAGADRLAAEVTPGGRLDGLLGALEQAVPPGSPLGTAVCVAVDPLLLETLTAMSHGYRVASPEGGISAGSGAQNARRWLERLRSAVQGRCVLPLPYADADLVALSRAGLTDLEALATSTGSRLVSELLGVQPLSGVSWPVGEMLDERTLADLTARETHAVLLDPHGITRPPAGSAVVSLVGDSSPDSVGLLTDPLLTSALAHPANPLSAQDGLGLLVARAASGQPILLVPPRRWQTTSTEATALLTTARQLLEIGLATPRELPALASIPPIGPTAALKYPVQARAGEIPAQVTAEIRQDRDILHDLQVATVLDPAPNLRPAALLDPLRLGLLRSVSTAWRQAPARSMLLAAESTAALEKLRASVQIVGTPGPYTLASPDSPLLITVGNELPVGMQVTLTLSATAGLRAGRVGPQLVPARSTRQLVIPAEVSRAGQFNVTVRLSTPGGTSLGEPSSLQVRSTAFGTLTVALTASAGAALLLLVAQRFVRRARRRARKAR